MSVDPHNHTTLHLTKFFLFISVFLVAISILAVFSTIAATEYGTKKDDLQSVSLTHLLKSIDWLQAQIDTLNATLQNAKSNLSNMSSPVASGSATDKPIYSSFTNYKSYINKLHADKSGSLANLKYNEEIENRAYENSLIKISDIS